MIRAFPTPFALAPVALALTVAGVAIPAHAQTRMVSREVVQPLPAQTSADLTRALSRLAQDTKDVTALIDAGVASLELGDTDAALGFFGRAQELSPQDARIKAGFAAAYARQQRPVEALRLFDEAERAGVAITRLAGERGLAYDLVGAGKDAQRNYHTALDLSDDPEVRRRLALSYAIGGDRTAFESTLRPLLDLQDPAAFRARAFGLAILGDGEAAVAILEAAMPRETARKLTPYLRYMPQLTAAQQAAAANLGVFPRATQIGRDDPRIASAAGSFGAAEARLRPSGAPLGPAVTQAAPAAKAATPARKLAAASAPKSKPERARAETTQAGVRVAEAGRPRGELPPVTAAAVQPATSANAAPAPALILPDDETPAPAGVTVAASAPSAPRFDLSKVPDTPLAQTGRSASTEPAPSPTSAPASAPAPAASVASAFADLTLPADPIRARPGNAVDITRIKVRREVAPTPEPEPAAKAELPKPAKPANPSRIWVQVATGKDRDALGWDWRRFTKKAGKVLDGKGPFTAPWGEANRLLAGPYTSRKEADAALDELKEAGIDGFLFTSRAGEEIAPLS
ncbi:SPOR domain-containing protein [Erythrobacter sp. LQ02-29]|uniref:SPOR domain-containing protein n=1 Tax=Erythrobacter sp. LQ02-29 TaxID=2920384 RepID=UPI001F4E1DB2|nr:SPOR domain-containing protein [Erythrobacter sp. LQ02-29]MCP9222541.1 SPOR domain-containing protein [Erythrobacter sp. LQ02-29]